MGVIVQRFWGGGEGGDGEGEGEGGWGEENRDSSSVSSLMS